MSRVRNGRAANSCRTDLVPRIGAPARSASRCRPYARPNGPAAYTPTIELSPSALVISRRIVLLLAALLALVLVAPRVAAAQQLDVIRGQVTGDDDDPIENANITATS